MSSKNCKGCKKKCESAAKGGPARRKVPLHPKFISLLKEWRRLDDGAGYIVHHHKKPIKSIKKAWAGALDRANITRRIRPYDIRHMFVTRALEAGADIKALAEVVGSRPETLMRHHQHVRAAMHKKIIDDIDPLNPPLKIVR